MFNYNRSSTNYSAIPISNNMENDQNDLGHISNGKWTDAQRRIVWMLLVKARAGLKIEINPVVATAFVILQKYFRSLDKNDDDEQTNENDLDSNYDLLTLMTAALFTACKMNDETIRPMEFIFNELSKICLNAPSQKVRLILGSRIHMINSNFSNHFDVKLCYDDFKIISKCEIDLLDATGFDIDFDLPFRYFNEILSMLNSLLPRDSMHAIYNTWLIDTCLMICSQYYLDLPPEVAAAAAVADSFQNRPTIFNLKSIQQKTPSQPQIQFNQQTINQTNIPVAIVAPEGAPQYIIDWVEGIK
mgnify:CR=1 FL=1